VIIDCVGDELHIPPMCAVDNIRFLLSKEIYKKMIDIETFD